jgi:phospholipid/cholesterol/gamma-HCH transport system substrate-binding protein
MKQNMVETLLGAFVLTVAIIFFICGTSTASIGAGGGTYVVNAQFTDIGSLGVGDDVKISGVVVGQVAEIELDPVIYNASVNMSIDSDVELPYDTSARITSEGLLGGTYLALDVGGDTEMLEDGDSIAITQSAQNLEQLLGQFIFSLQDTKNE